MSNSQFEAEAFYAALDAHRESLGKTWKQVAKEAHVSASTLTRMGQGKRPDVDGLAALIAWSGLSMDDFLSAKLLDSNQPEALGQMTALLRADKNLSKDSALLLESLLRSAYQTIRKDKDET